MYEPWIKFSREVSFNSNGGSEVASQKVGFNEMAITPELPTKTGYVLEGWYTDEDLSSRFDFNSPIKASLTLYAKWIIPTIEYMEVTFNSNGGSEVASQTVLYDGYAKEPEPPTQTGYSFTGWYLDSVFNTSFDFASPITESITLHAKWDLLAPESREVSFDPNGGSLVASQTVNKNDYATEPTPPTRSGYTFDGWFTDSLLTTRFAFTTPITENITLYAKWISGTVDLLITNTIGIINQGITDKKIIGIGPKLIDQLNKVTVTLAKNDKKTAIRLLNQFISTVNSQSGRKIEVITAESLVAQAKNMIKTISNP